MLRHFDAYQAKQSGCPFVYRVGPAKLDSSLSEILALQLMLQGIQQERVHNKEDQTMRIVLAFTPTP